MTYPKKPMVQFDNIKVNAIETNSGIFVGTNTQFSWNTTSFNKSGFGSISGHQNAIAKNLSIFHDDDIIDTPIRHITGIPPQSKVL